MQGAFELPFLSRTPGFPQAQVDFGDCRERFAGDFQCKPGGLNKRQCFLSTQEATLLVLLEQEAVSNESTRQAPAQDVLRLFHISFGFREQTLRVVDIAPAKGIEPPAQGVGTGKDIVLDSARPFIKLGVDPIKGYLICLTEGKIKRNARPKMSKCSSPSRRARAIKASSCDLASSQSARLMCRPLKGRVPRQELIQCRTQAVDISAAVQVSGRLVKVKHVLRDLYV